MTGREEGERLIFTITDNGVGFDPAAVHPNSPSRLGGVGLRNVDERLKLYYGAGCGITVRSAPGKGCTVCLTVKKRTERSP